MFKSSDLKFYRVLISNELKIIKMTLRNKEIREMNSEILMNQRGLIEEYRRTFMNVQFCVMVHKTVNLYEMGGYVRENKFNES